MLKTLKPLNKKNQTLGISLPTEVINKIDKGRGDISRSRYLLRRIEKTFQ